MNDDYIAYLRGQGWRDRRKEFLEDADYECEDCGEKATQVHHLNYECLGEEERDDVEVLCKECHVMKELEKGTDMEGEDCEYGEY